MKLLLLALAASTAITTGASAENIGVSMALFDDNFLMVLRNGIQKYADENGLYRADRGRAERRRQGQPRPD